jgi:hypothetical protein
MTQSTPNVLKSLKALALTITFLIGGGSAIVADVVRHHLDEAEQHEGSHVEVPGSCVEHLHRCDLGMSPTGPKLTAPRPDHVQAEAGAALSISAVLQHAPSPHDLFLLPDSRAPPVFG